MRPTDRQIQEALACGPIRRLPDVVESVSAMQPILASLDISNFYTVESRWGGCGSNPRSADYENYGPALPTLYLRGYHGAVPPMALIALYGTDGSVHEPVHGHHSERLTSTTERHHTPREIRLHAIAERAVLFDGRADPGELNGRLWARRARRS